MATYVLTGSDDLFLNNRQFKDFSNNSTITITFPNEKISLSTGKNGNTILSENKQGENVQVELRIVAGSDDDIWLNGLNVQQSTDLPGFAMLNGSYSKRIGDGSGNVRRVNYALQGGFFRQNVNSQEKTAGDAEQGTAVYKLIFASGSRTIF